MLPAPAQCCCPLSQFSFSPIPSLACLPLPCLPACRSPQVNPELEGPTLPSKSDEEFRPFVRRLPELKFWWSSLKALLLGLGATFFPMFDVPVFWPILLLYWWVAGWVVERAGGRAAEVWGWVVRARALL
jgi:hypothetical protein